MPQLAERFTVIAPDLPGIGDSAIPASGLDMKTAGSRMHALAVSLGIKKAEVVSTSETTCVSSLVYLGGAVDEFLWSVDVRSCGKLSNLGFAANEPLWMRDMRCVQNLLPSF